MIIFFFIQIASFFSIYKLFYYNQPALVIKNHGVWSISSLEDVCCKAGLSKDIKAPVGKDLHLAEARLGMK